MTPAADALTVLYGAIIGLALGLTGAGGSIFALPLLIYGLAVPAHDAVGISLATVALTAAFGAAAAARAKLIEYRVGFIFAGAGMLAAPVGVGIARGVPEKTILIGFAGLTLIVAAAMWRRSLRDPKAAAIVRADFASSLDADGVDPICRFNPDRQLRLTNRCGAVLAATGIGTGILSGLFGVGGGFIIVPALSFVTRMDVHRAVATSLFVITLVAVSGAAAVLFDQDRFPWALTAWFMGGGVTGMSFGRLLAHRIAGPGLLKIFSVAMLLMAAFVLLSKLH